MRLLALGADHAHQALGEDGFERRGHEIRLDPHIHQPGHGAGGIVGVQRREDQVPGQRGLDGDLRRLVIADFADEDDVGVVTQNRPQAAGERQSRLASRPGSG